MYGRGYLKQANKQSLAVVEGSLEVKVNKGSGKWLPHFIFKKRAVKAE
jgi:hypothetical protein